MAVNEEARHQLYLGLEEVLGRERAATLMELLPPTGWADVASRRDLDHLSVVLRAEMETVRGELRAEMEAVRGELKQEMADLRGELRTEMRAVRGELGTLRQGLDALGRETKAEIDALGHRLTATFESRLNDAVASQTRAIIFSMVAYFLGVVALAVSLRG